MGAMCWMCEDESECPLLRKMSYKVRRIVNGGKRCQHFHEEGSW